MRLRVRSANQPFDAGSCRRQGAASGSCRLGVTSASQGQVYQVWGGYETPKTAARAIDNAGA